MPSKKVNVLLNRAANDGESGAVLLDEQLMRAMRIPEGRPVWLTAGTFRQKVFLKPTQRKRALLLSKILLQRFGMHDGLRLHIRYDATSQTLRCGPLLAVLLQRSAVMPAARPFGEMSDFCRELALVAGREHVWLAAVTPNSFQLTNQSMQGWTFRRGWRRAKLPIADVIYNRLQTRKLEKSRNVQRLMKNIKSHFSTVIFNEQFLDKVSVFTALSKDSSMHKHLPRSLPCRNLQVIRQMLEQYPTLFLKPATGSMGRGIVRIARNPDGGYTTHSTHIKYTSKRHYADRDRLLRSLAAQIKRAPHLIQQGLSLLTVYRHNLDFRALVQKDGSGKWTVTSIVARIAAPRHFVSNLARGGRITTVMDALRKAGVSRDKAQKLHASMRATAVAIAGSLEKQLNGSFGELGVDLAVDRDLHVWLLEVNSKPSKTDPLPPGTGKIRPSARKVVQYAKHAGKF